MLKRFLSYFLISALVSPTLVAQGWELQTPLPQRNAHKDTRFPDENKPVLFQGAENVLNPSIALPTDSVSIAWIAYYTANTGDVASDLSVDKSGNVYVTGRSTGTSEDYATVKYDAFGVEQWVARYNGPGNSEDNAKAIATDDAGNVYVTGNSYGSGSSDDYATIKYDASGNQMWVARYNGSSGGPDIAWAIAVDDFGNVYVTGNVDDFGDSDYGTIKYNPNGVQLWASRYNGPAQSGDYARDIGLDNSGNVYVTGTSEGIGTGNDYATIKYDASGVEQWVARYNAQSSTLYGDGAKALVVDGQGNIYVTGSIWLSTSYYDFMTIKYNSSGDIQWYHRYTGSTIGWDLPAAIALDGSGNIYVTGSSNDGEDYREFATVKYNSAGTQKWVARYSRGFGIDNFPRDIAVDDLGNVYVVGDSYNKTSPSDYVTIKYDSSGGQQWVVPYNGPGNSDDGASAIAVDSSGSVYVVGYSTGLGTGWDYTTIKYALPNPLAQLGVAYGSTGDAEPNNPGALITLDPATGVGTLVGPTGIIGDGGPSVRALAIRSTGEIYAMSNEASSDLYSVHASTGAGTFVVNTGLEYPGDIVFDQNDVLYAVDQTNTLFILNETTGTTTAVGPTGVSLAGLACDPTSGLLYGSSGSMDLIYEINTTTGAAILVGSTGLGVGTPDIHFDQDGNLFGAVRGAGNIYDYISIDKLTGAGSIIGSTGFYAVVGLATRLEYTPTLQCGVIFFFNAKCNANGAAQAMVKMTGDWTGETVTFDLDGDKYVSTVMSNGTNSIAKMTVPHAGLGPHTVTLEDPAGCYSPVAITCMVDAPPDPEWDALWAESEAFEARAALKVLPSEARLIGNYPNPFNPLTTISYELPVNTHVTLTVTDIIGREVVRLQDGYQEAGYKTVPFDASTLASGIYFYRLQAGDFVETKKLILMK